MKILLETKNGNLIHYKNSDDEEEWYYKNGKITKMKKHLKKFKNDNIVKMISDNKYKNHICEVSVWDNGYELYDFIIKDYCGGMYYDEDLIFIKDHITYHEGEDGAQYIDKKELNNLLLTELLKQANEEFTKRIKEMDNN